MKQLLILRDHHYIAQNQAKYLTKLKSELDYDSCILIGDFSENYSFIVQDAIQAFHWVNTQATLHPFVAYIRCKETHVVKPISMCVISDCLMHTTTAVYAFQKVIISHLKTADGFTGSKIMYFSDGAAGQYKNRKNFGNLLFHKDDFFGIEAEWHFFATSHGKNACDGIGGSTKRLARIASIRRPINNQILTPEDLFKFADEDIHGIKLFFVGSEDIFKCEEDLKSRFDACKRVPNTRESHCFVPQNDSTIRAYRISGGKIFQDANVFLHGLKKKFSITPKVSQYVACAYDDKWYIGMVVAINIDEGDSKIKFMIPPGPSVSFHWEPISPTWIPNAKILKIIEAPKTEKRRQYKISPALQEELDELLSLQLAD